MPRPHHGKRPRSYDPHQHRHASASVLGPREAEPIERRAVNLLLAVAARAAAHRQSMETAENERRSGGHPHRLPLQDTSHGYPGETDKEHSYDNGREEVRPGRHDDKANDGGDKEWQFSQPRPLVRLGPGASGTRSALATETSSGHAR